MKKFIPLLVSILMIISLTACAAGATSAASAVQNPVTTSVQAAGSGSTAAVEAATTVEAATSTEVAAENSQTHADPGDATYDAAAVIPIVLNGDTIQVESQGVSVDGSVATITAPGTYSLSGSLADGQIIVNTTSEEIVRLVLNGVDIHSSTSAPIYIVDAEKTVILTAENTQNTLSDGTTYVFAVPADEEPSAAIFSKSDLTLAGSGSLTVNANFRDGISSKDGLVISSGTITVNAVDDGIRGKDYVVVEDGSLTVNAQGDGLKADNEEDAAKGYISIAAGTLQVTAGGDAINAQTDVIIQGGTFTLSSGGGSGSAAEAVSAKGIKGVVNVTIDGGTFSIDAADDAVHSNGSITINGGTFSLATADDGMHADQTLTVNGGDIRVTQSYEGLESAVITLNNGTIHVAASDDGVNVGGGQDASGMNPGGGPGRGAPAQDAFTYTGSYYLYIHGGYLFVDARGDGIDINGAIEMTGGVVLVNGPTEQMNGALDYDGGFNITGGSLVAAGSSGMAMAPDQSSSQYSTLIYLTQSVPAGTLVHIQNSAGEDVLTFAPTIQYQSVAFSSAALTSGDTYTITTGGSSTGTAADGLYQGGSYTPGTQYTSFTPASTVTTVGTGGRMGGPRR